MCSEPTHPGHQPAIALWEDGVQKQMDGDLAAAEELYEQSLALHPTAEAWTFLGWLASMRGEHHQAIDHCHRAISVDPTFGNPYNDIGAYLIELGRWEESIPWLLRATEAPRYEARVYPWMNLGRAYEQLGRVRDAISHYRKALEVDRHYTPATRALDRLVARRNGHVQKA